MIHGRGIQRVVELGAGSAPLTRVLGDVAENGLKLTPCDLYPDVDSYTSLAAKHPEQIEPVYAPVDFRQEKDWGEASAVILCATFHHIREEERNSTLDTLLRGADLVLVFEPLRNTLFSMTLVLFAVFPALMTPVVTLRQAGLLRRMLFCWLIPIVPPMFVWDAVVSCLRQWSPRDWLRYEATLAEGGPTVRVFARPHSSTVVLDSNRGRTANVCS